MGLSSSTILDLILIFFLCFLSSSNADNNGVLQTYIVHVESPDDQFSSSLRKEDLDSWYQSFLPPPSTTTVAGDHGDLEQSESKSQAQPHARIVYSYYNVIKGFSAELTQQQVKEMEKKPGFVSARVEKTLSLHTTHSPTFLGLQRNVAGVWNDSGYGNGVIIGVIDTGVTPNHPSFSDRGMSPAPKKWKGECLLNSGCNNKLIGARNFVQNASDPRDQIGHGTHTAGTAAGNFVNDANVFGSARGVAAGVAPLAHIATYKVCSPDGCTESSILAAMDSAIEDGVDVLSLSMGGDSEPFYTDVIALGAFSAIKNGIFVSCSAGNAGPFPFTLSNGAPWILTVGASTIDRKIVATAILGNNLTLEGETANQPKDFPAKQFPLFLPQGEVSDFNGSFCSYGSLDESEVKGKIVICTVGGQVPRKEKGEVVKAAGGVGMILINQEEYGSVTLAEDHVLPVTHLSYLDGLKLLDYINSTRFPTASISFKGTVIGDKHSPTVAGFSSRGPNGESPGILKPDIIGPGVNILAAWNESLDSVSNFNMISGTSMSCPHLSGVAALIKSVHPDWSPAAIKSAIMTTADQLNLDNKPIEDQSNLQADVFAVGSGHVNPSKAKNPGLIYDIELNDYIPYLCGLNFTATQMSAILQRKFICTTRIPEAELNYPSFSIVFGAKTQTYNRTVTNVGEANSSYTVKVVPPENVEVTVKPETLKFTEVNQKLGYEVTFRQVEVIRDRVQSQGYLTWNSEKYSVRSPILVIHQ